MKLLLISSAAILALTACATGPSAYGPAVGNDLGFKNTKIEKDRFRVRYSGRSPEEARDYALLRAAQIALNEGYSHFKVVNGTGYNNGPNAPISSHLGIGIGQGFGGRTRTHTNLGVGIYDVARAVEGSKATEEIEIFLQNTGSNGGKIPNVYEAQSVVDSIRPQVFK